MPTGATRSPPTSSTTSEKRAVPGSAAELQEQRPAAAVPPERPFLAHLSRVILTRFICGSINVRERPLGFKHQPIDCKRYCTDQLNAQKISRHSSGLAETSFLTQVRCAPMGWFIA